MVSNPNPCRLCLEARKGHLGIKSIDLACILSAVEGRDMFGDCAERIKSESAATRLLPLRATFARRTWDQRPSAGMVLSGVCEPSQHHSLVAN